MLARRLARRGVAPSGVMPAAGLPACVPASLVSSTVTVGRLYGAGQAVVPAGVAALTQGVLKDMCMNKVKTFAGMVLVAVMVVLGGEAVYRHAAAGQPEVQAEKPPARASVAGQGGKPTTAPATKERKARLEVRADGKQVQVRVICGDEEFQAIADSMNYDEDSGRLILEGNVRMRQQRQGQKPQQIQGRRMVIDRKTGKVSVEGAGRIGMVVPMLGSTPAALDFGFPISTGPHKKGAGENHDVPKRPGENPADSGIPSMKKELDELRERVKKLENRLSDAAAGAKEFATAEFYRRTGHLGSAYFYYELVSRRYPGTSHASKAKERMDDLRSLMAS